jgi:hypothetical protein
MERIAQQRQMLADSFRSPSLSYEGTEVLFYSSQDGGGNENAWKFYVRKEGPLAAIDIRYFIQSCLAVAKKEKGSDVDELINQLSSGDRGFPRLREICQARMTADDAFNKNLISFQCDVVAFLTLLTQRALRSSTLEKQVNTIYHVVYEHIEEFIGDQAMRCLDQLVRQNSLRHIRSLDENIVKRGVSLPMTFAQPFILIARLLCELVTRFKEASINQTIHKIENRLQNAVDAWKESLYAGRLQDDLFVKFDESTRGYAFQILDKDLDMLKKLLAGGKRSIDAAIAIRAQTHDNRAYHEARQVAREVDLQRQHDPPGMMSFVCNCRVIIISH